MILDHHILQTDWNKSINILSTSGCLPIGRTFGIRVRYGLCTVVCSGKRAANDVFYNTIR